MLDFQDLKAAEGYIEKYYSWEIFETIMAVILCVVQVNMIQGMLKGSSIVWTVRNTITNDDWF